MICQHQAAHPVAHGRVRAPLGQRHLDARGSPGDKRRQLALADAQQALVHVGRVDLTLYHVQDGNVAALLGRHRRHHAVFGLEQPAHHVQHRRLAHRLGLLHLVPGEWCVRRHEEVAARRRDERREDADEVVVHVPRVAERGCARRHDG